MRETEEVFNLAGRRLPRLPCGTWRATLPAAQFDAASPGGNPNANPYCGKKTQITSGRKSVVVTVVDRCAGCATGDVDLSPAAFDQLADPSVGRLHVTWTTSS
jgi:expansin (peptidoglycan-binding protein)